MEYDFAVFTVEALHCGRFAHEGYYDFSVVCRLLAAYDNFIAVVYAGFDHRSALHVKHEKIFPAKFADRERIIFFVILVSKNRLPRSHRAEQGNIHGI